MISIKDKYKTLSVSGLDHSWLVAGYNMSLYSQVRLDTLDSLDRMAELS